MATEQQRDASLQAECSVVMTFTAYVELVLLSLRVWRYNPLMVQDSRHFWFMATSGSWFSDLKVQSDPRVDDKVNGSNLTLTEN